MRKALSTVLTSKTLEAGRMPFCFGSGTPPDSHSATVRPRGVVLDRPVDRSLR